MTEITWTEIGALQSNTRPDISVSSPEADARAGWTKIEDRLFALRRLEDDWDGMGAFSPSHEIVDSALVFLKQQKASDAPAPGRVVAGPNGEIVFEWQTADIVLEAQIEEPGTASWVIRARGKPTVYIEQEFEKTYQDALWGGTESAATLVPDSAAA